MPLMPSDSERGPKPRRHLLVSLSRGAFRAVLLMLITLWSLLLLGWLILHWGILPHIDEWRPQVEAHASRALGVSVRIGRIEARSPGWVPVLALHDVQLADAAGRPALTLPLVSAAVSPRSLLVLSLRFSQLYIEGAQLEVRRDRSGHLHVGGLAFNSGADGSDGLASNWFFAQPEFVVRHGQLRWVDEQRDAPPLALEDVDIVVRNSLRHHDLRLDATPPAGWGQRFSARGRFTQPLLAPAGDWQRWNGTLHADLPYVDVASLHQHVQLPFELLAGQGSLRAWLDLAQGQWRAATLDMALQTLQLRLGRELAPLALRSVSGRLQAEREPDRVRLDARELAFATEDGVAWPASRVALSWLQQQDLVASLAEPDRQRVPLAAAAASEVTPETSASAPEPTASEPAAASSAIPFATANAAPITGGEFSADRLDLALLARMASRLPLPATLLRTLQDSAPQGLVQGLQLSWSGPPQAPEHYRVKGRLSGSSLSAQPPEAGQGPGRPGWRGADLDLQANETGGEARLSVTDGALELPGVFEDPLVPLARFQARLVWQLQPRPGLLPAIQLLVQDGHFANEDGQGDVSARWQTGEGLVGAAGEPPGSVADHGAGARFPGRLELSGHATQLKAARVARYLPLGVGTSARQYVSGAVLGGDISQLNFKLRGDLWHFPFPKAAEGEFHIAAKVHNLDFAYVPADPGAAPAWPAFSQLSGDLVFDRVSMQIRNAQARLWGLALTNVNGDIRDLMVKPALSIDGTVRGPLADGLRYVLASPVDRLISGALHDTVGTGPMTLQLGLVIPFDDVNNTSVKGQVQLAGNEIRLRPDLPVFANTQGRVDFSQHGFSVSGGAARLVGGDATFEGNMGPDGIVRFQGQGVATAEGLRRASELGWVAKLGTQLSGQSPYKLQLGVVHGQTELLITSPLTGMASALPAPLGKAAETALPLRYQTTLGPSLPVAGGAAAITRDTLRIELGNLLQAEYQRDISQPTPVVLRGALAVGDTLPTLTPGTVQALLKLGTVDIDAWRNLATQLAGPAAGDAAGTSAHSSYEPTDISLRAQSLAMGGRKLTRLSAQAQRRAGADGEHWRANLQADQAQGQIDYRPQAGERAGLVHARFARLALPQSEADAVDDILDDPGDHPPALDIVIDDFELAGKRLGKLEVDAAYKGADWRLSKLNLTSPEAKLVGSGQWSPGPRRRMALDFRLDLSDSGAMLERMGMGRVMRGGKGHVQGQLAWTGSPLTPEWAEMTGQMQLALDSGQFLKVDAGAGRLLGVLSLQNLPRRLLLDFRDVFQEGFAFDNASADIALADGVARTNNLRIRSAQAVVLMEGSANMRQETQNLRVVVVPEINAGTASLAYAAINPVIGLGTFLAQWFLRKPLMQASTREFQVTGPWDKPNVVSVERKANEPLPDLDAPPLAASAASAP